MYSCRLYYNSGFNATNIPDNPAILDSINQYVDVPALEIMQDRFLSCLRVKTTWENVKDVDYCKLTGQGNPWYYAVTGIEMVAGDVATLYVVPDYISSVGGVAGLIILDGITQRVHVASDNYGQWNANDELLIPAEPLELRLGWFNTAQTVTNLRTVIESTVNPFTTATDMENKVFSDQTGQYSVCVPKVQPNTVETEYYVGTAQSAYSPKTCLYPFYNASVATTLADSLATLRSLGLEQCIISQTHLPSKFIDFVVGSGTDGLGNTYYYIDRATGKDIDISTTLDYVLSSNVKNNLINYSSLTKYGLITAAGNSCEYNPADLYVSGDQAPTIRCISDPHTDGKPYYRYKTVNGNNSVIGFWRNCVAGMPWKSIPLVFYDRSGNAINTAKFYNSQRINAAELELQKNTIEYQRQNMTLNTEIGMLSGAMSAIGGAVTGNIAGTLQGAAGATVSYLQGYNALSELQDRAGYYEKIHRAKRQSELYDLEIANNVTVPTVNFPFGTDVIRDTYGNGVLAYRYAYSSNDMLRIDKLLTMYGYKVSKPLEVSDFTNRQYFNFVLCNNITIGGHSKWMCDGIADQLKAGVRVWHVLPDVSKYADNPV